MRLRLFLLAALLATTLWADEGLWLFNKFPTTAVQQKHGITVTDGFLNHVRLASVEIGGGSGAFVSPNGLIVTNQHLVSACLGALSSAGHDLWKEGFYASAQAAELPCPGLSARVPLEIQDVTSQVKSAAKDAASSANTLQARKAEIGRLETRCSSSRGEACVVVTLYSGERYDLYRYKTYSDLRLVFAPEYEVAFFGRERDSITYLRYGLDVAFLRAYEDGKPAATPNFLKWSREGIKEGDFVFASGGPGATARATTAAQLSFYRDTYLPVTLARLATRIKELNAYAAESPANQNAAEPVLAVLLESYKSAAGRLIGLRDDRLIARKTVFDERIRHAVEEDPKLGPAAAKVWDQVTAAYKEWARFEKPYEILEGAPAPGSDLFRVARALVRHQFQLGSEIRVDKAVETILLAQYLDELKALGEKEAPAKSILAGRTPQQAAEALAKETKLDDPTELRHLAAASALPSNPSDGMLRLALALEQPARRVNRKREDILGALETSAAEKIAEYRYILFGDSEYPDGTGTPRLSFGSVKGYTDRAGIAQPWAATFSGLYYRKDSQGPYQVPNSWLGRRGKLNQTIPLDFVSTCDIGGGDPGSPTVNTAGELVGVLFDGDLESLPNAYLYTDDQARAVHVASQGIVEALDKIYGARPLIEELGLH